MARNRFQLGFTSCHFFRWFADTKFLRKRIVEDSELILGFGRMCSIPFETIYGDAEAEAIRRKLPVNKILENFYMIVFELPLEIIVLLARKYPHYLLRIDPGELNPVLREIPYAINAGIDVADATGLDKAWLRVFGTRILQAIFDLGLWESFWPDTPVWSYFRKDTRLKIGAFGRSPDACDFCREEEGGSVKLFTCGAFRIIHYCSRDCQKASWTSGHRENCGTDRVRAFLSEDESAYEVEVPKKKKTEVEVE